MGIEDIERADSTEFDDNPVWWRWFLAKVLWRPRPIPREDHLGYYPAVKVALSGAEWRTAEDPVRQIRASVRRILRDDEYAELASDNDWAMRSEAQVYLSRLKRELRGLVDTEQDSQSGTDLQLLRKIHRRQMKIDMVQDLAYPRSASDLTVREADVDTIDRLGYKAESRRGRSRDDVSLRDRFLYQDVPWNSILSRMGLDKNWHVANILNARKPSGANAKKTLERDRKRFERKLPTLQRILSQLEPAAPPSARILSPDFWKSVMTGSLAALLLKRDLHAWAVDRDLDKVDFACRATLPRKSVLRPMFASTGVPSEASEQLYDEITGIICDYLSLVVWDRDVMPEWHLAATDEILAVVRSRLSRQSIPGTGSSGSQVPARQDSQIS